MGQSHFLVACPIVPNHSFGELWVCMYVEFFNPIELSGTLSDKLRLKFGVPELFIRNLDVPRLRNDTRFQITQLGPKVVLANDITGIPRGESAKFYASR
ncbi:hypothetical protein AVEN_98408-1 [Araneus ventricosus]|uniref:DNA helicase Pif1-like 2B domain-containing protein n=1 Tax=Araneus ventricosus TaxID=182803 RepID=A0A4Y2JYY7_ARAVE|nr:hypothetical protein AVEN_98408-1 [Araneus ventricosus]